MRGGARSKQVHRGVLFYQEWTAETTDGTASLTSLCCMTNLLLHLLISNRMSRSANRSDDNRPTTSGVDIQLANDAVSAQTPLRFIDQRAGGRGRNGNQLDR